MDESSTLNKIKTISRVFNSSFAFEQFLIYLDLENITLDEATMLYEKYCPDIVALINKACSFSMCSKLVFKDIFCKNNVDISKVALPYIIRKTMDSYSFRERIEMQAISADNSIIKISYSCDLIEDMMTLHKIDTMTNYALCMMLDLAWALKRLKY